MFRKDKHSDSDKHDECRKRDGVFVGRKHFPSETVFINAAFRDENRIVVTHSENECRQNDIDYIKLNVKYLHDGKNPNPADCEW